MEEVKKTIRYIVSKDKRRFVTDKHDLDLVSDEILQI